ncbi:MAG: SNF2 helicase associated domain-containing protein, partial [Psychrilyobacter sp.]|nr:SNF2 helicase associated domain-containing protein [Psychrilyobacter sp.]
IKQLKNYGQVEKEKEKEKIEVEYNLSKENYIDYELKTRIGIKGKKKYLTKNLVEFIENYKANNSYIFGKEFEFIPEKHKLNDYDYNILNELTRVCKITTEALEEYNRKQYYYTRQVNFNVGKKKIILSDEWFKVFLDNLSGKENILLDGKNIRMASKNDYILQIDGENVALRGFSLLTKDAKCILVENEIFKIEEQDRELIKILEEVISLKNEKQKKSEEIKKLIFPLVKESNIKSIEVLKEVGESVIYISENKDRHGFLSIDVRIVTNRETFIDGKRYLLKENIKEMSKIFKIITGESRKKDFNTTLFGEEDSIKFLIEQLPDLNKKYDVRIEENLKKIKYKTISIDGNITKNGELLEIKFNTNGISDKDLRQIQLGILSNRKYIKLENNEIINLANKKMRELEGILVELENGLEDQEISEFAASKLGLMSPDIKRKNIGDLKIEKLLKSMRKDDKEELPTSINANLRDYQKDGYYWMKKLHDSGLGGILADDMGLGKTIQTISLLTKIHSKNNLISIVIAPTSLTHNWLKEIKKFSPSLEAIIVEGSPKDRIELLKNFKNGVILTSYGSFRKDISIYEELNFSIAVLDEAQHIKNTNTLIKKAVKKIKSDSRFALTGTPIENSIFELWSIFDFVIPTYLQNKERFKKKYGQKIHKDMDENSLVNLKKIIKPFILRRTKSEVLKELPDKIETNMVLGMDKIQKKYYLSYLSQFKGELEEHLGEEGFNKSRIKILALLTRLRQICCTPELFIENYKGRSTKVEAIMELLEELKSSGHKVLVFSQFVKTFGILKNRLDEKKITYFQIDGSTKAKKRLEMCDLFNDGEKDIFLISLKAGGSGLNLTGADVVIHFDPWWNPAVEVQATDRAHRIGQEKVVQVIKLITEGTIEEKIVEIQKNKAKLIDTMTSSDGKIEKLTKEDILGLFD